MSTFTLKDFEIFNEGLGTSHDGWEINLSRCCVLVHDAIDYYTSKLCPTVYAELATGIGCLVTWADSHNVPILASAPRPAHSLNQRGLGGKLWGIGPTQTQMSEFLIDGLKEPAVPLIRKRSLSAFYETDLEAELRRLDKDQLIISGVFTGGGILATSFDALARDIEFFVIADASADLDYNRHSTALKQIGETTGHVISLSYLPSH